MTREAWDGRVKLGRQGQDRRARRGATRIGASAILALLLLDACAGGRAPPRPAPVGLDAPRALTPPASAPAWVRCGPTEACAPREKAAHRQYYDVHHRRYYYYDPMTRRYYWESGQPKT